MTLYARTDRIISLMRELAATFIRAEANTLPLITVISADVSSDLRKGTIFVSVFPEAQEEQALIFLKRKAGAFRSFVKQKARLKDIPHFDFALDRDEKHRRILGEIAYEQANEDRKKK